MLDAADFASSGAFDRKGLDILLLWDFGEGEKIFWCFSVGLLLFLLWRWVHEIVRKLYIKIIIRINGKDPPNCHRYRQE